LSNSGTSRGNRTPVPARPSKKGRPGGGRPGTGRPAASARPGAPRPPSRGGQAAWQARRRRNQLLALVSVVVVIAVVVVIVTVGLSGGKSTTTGNRAAAPAAQVTKVTGVSTGTLTSAVSSVPSLYPLQAISGPPLSSAGKPEVLFIGAEFCPICATERWPLVVALSRFGTFSNLSQIHSAVTDGNIPTFSFYGASYSSPYLVFKPVEAEDRNRKPLQTPTKSENALWYKYTYSASSGSVSFPFADFGGKYVLTTAQFPPQTLEGNLSFNQVAALVGDNNNTIGADIDASAAVLTKVLCSMTGDKPAATCQAVASVSLPKATAGTGPSSSAG